MATSPPKFKLPRIHSVELRRFSLFSANPDAKFSTGDGVLCLIGANGIGKSTLLSAINFCLTGTVPDPTRTFESIDEYYKYTRTYSASYFRGRIAGMDEDDAEITLTFRIENFEYEVRRGLFEPDELRGLAITDRSQSEAVPEVSEEMPRSERHGLYAESLVRHTGLASFQEFVFLQHFVFTFDEQRKTLFWNPRIMERVLYRTFGLDPNMAKEADSLRREIQQQDSRVRNSQWEATRMRKRINEIRAQQRATAGAQERYDELIATHQELSQQFDEDSKDLRQAEDALRDSNLRLADLSVRETAVRDDYAKLFDRRFDLRPPLAKHPLVAQSIENGVCGLCGNASRRISAAITAHVNEKSCPLCDSELTKKSPAPEDAKKLRDIDKELGQLRKSINDTHKTLTSLRSVEVKSRERWEKTKQSLDEFDNKNTSVLESLRQSLGQKAGELSLKDYREQLASLDKEKSTAYDKREKLKKQQSQLQRNLERQYVQVEEKFVPKFAALAQQFLGMPLSVQMDARGVEDVKLVVTVRGTTRRLQQNLSESQRFFLDIALRMALTQQMSDTVSSGGMYIDTPEGSLDIAYEKRAGDMLAMFSEAGHQIIMTANLNSSQLLLALARKCGRSGLRLCRIMDWAELSEVQQEESALFDEAYSKIEAAMNQEGSRT